MTRGSLFFGIMPSIGKLQEATMGQNRTLAFGVLLPFDRATTFILVGLAVFVLYEVWQGKEEEKRRRRVKEEIRRNEL